MKSIPWTCAYLFYYYCQQRKFNLTNSIIRSEISDGCNYYSKQIHTMGILDFLLYKYLPSVSLNAQNGLVTCDRWIFFSKTDSSCLQWYQLGLRATHLLDFWKIWVVLGSADLDNLEFKSLFLPWVFLLFSFIQLFIFGLWGSGELDSNSMQPNKANSISRKKSVVYKWPNGMK